MIAVSVVLSGLLLGVMIAISAYGWLRLPRDYRFSTPFRHSFGSRNGSISKTVALGWNPLGGAVVMGLFIADAEHGLKIDARSRLVLLAVLVTAVPIHWLVVWLWIKTSAHTRPQEQ